VLLGFWALVLWGTLLLGSALVDLPAEGAGAVALRLLPAQGASVWAWLNALTVPLAILVWLLLGALVVRGRRTT
jgi:hypothetical protein